MLDAFPTWAAEFPNDNPALHEGVSWVCLSVCGPVKPVMRPKSAARPLASVAALVPAMSRDAVVTRAPIAEAPAAPAPAETSIALPIETPRVDAEEPVPTLSAEELAAREAPAAIVEEIERLPESVLGELLEKLTLDLTPARSVPMDDVLDIDASDLDGAPVESPAVEMASVTAAPEEQVEAASDEPSSDATEAPVETAAVAAQEPSQTVEITVISSAEDSVSSSVVKDDPTPASDAPDDYAAFVSVLVEVLLSHGATRAGAVLPSLLSDGTADAALLDRDTVSALGAAKIATESEGSVRLRDDFVVMARAWQDVLRGTTQDLGACGTTTLDGWASDLVRALGVGREGRVDVRRELRRRGVAAFGMLRAA